MSLWTKLLKTFLHIQQDIAEHRTIKSQSFIQTLKMVINSTLTASANMSYHGTVPWYQLVECAVAPYGFVFYYGVKVLNLVLGTPSNISVIWQIASKKKDASTSDTFIFNLAMLDAFFCLMTPIDLVNNLLVHKYHIWYLIRFAYGMKDLAPLFLVCICLDRYMAVVHPVQFSGIRDNSIRLGTSGLVWIPILAFGLTKSILGHSSVANMIFSSVILFAFAIMLFCNISIIWALRRSVRGKETMHPVKKKAFKMVLINLAIIVVNYLPPVALLPFASYYSFVAFNCKIKPSVFAIMDLSCSIEPLLYISKMEHMDFCQHCFSKTHNTAST